jgi:hypothetical protein
VLAEPVSELLAVGCDDLDGHVAWIGEDQNGLLRHLPACSEPPPRAPEACTIDVPDVMIGGARVCCPGSRVPTGARDS